MPTYTHRLAQPNDLPHIVAIYNSTVASRDVTADTEPVSVASRQQWFDDHQPERRPLWIIHPEGEPDTILGWMSYSNFYGRPAYSGTAELSIYIAESWRGKGI
ncbi:MAG: N-acetyltransferase family protein, partial [Gammaproteobacteria bacterium]